MAVPKSKTSKSKRNMRRSHHALSTGTYGEDKSTGEIVRRHHVCATTGEYRGRKVVETK